MKYEKFIKIWLCCLPLIPIGMSLNAQERDEVKILPIEINQDEKQSGDEERVVQGFGVPITSHPSSNHFYEGHTFYGDQIRLEDGSYWLVRTEHQNAIKDWAQGQRVYITLAPHPWYGYKDDFKFMVVNIDANSAVEIKKAAEPELNNVYRRWIREINYDINGRAFLILSDGTIWPLYSQDKKVWEIWQPGDTIVLGINDSSFFSWVFPNLLINVSCSCEYITAKKQTF